MNNLTPEQIEAIREQRRIRAERKANRLQEWATKNEAKAETIDNELRQYDMQFWTEPIKIGHHSERRHTNLRNRLSRKMDASHELFTKAQEQKQKAENILKYGTRVQGDAEREREVKRKEQDAVIGVGTKIKDFCFGFGEVVKVNKKTYTIKFSETWQTTRDKTYVVKVEANQ